MSFSVKLFVFQGEDSTKSESKYPLQTTQYTHYTGDARRPKTFFNPRHCFCAFAHYCLRRTAIKVGGGMSSSQLAVHHYRHACLKTPNKTTGGWGIEDCTNRQRSQRYSDRMVYFQDKLYGRVQHVKKSLMLL